MKLGNDGVLRRRAVRSLMQEGCGPDPNCNGADHQKFQIRRGFQILATWRRYGLLQAVER